MRYKTIKCKHIQGCKLLETQYLKHTKIVLYALLSLPLLAFLSKVMICKKNLTSISLFQLKSYKLYHACFARPLQNNNVSQSLSFLDFYFPNWKEGNRAVASVWTNGGSHGRVVSPCEWRQAALADCKMWTWEKEKEPQNLQTGTYGRLY